MSSLEVQTMVQPAEFDDAPASLSQLQRALKELEDRLVLRLGSSLGTKQQRSVASIAAMLGTKAKQKGLPTAAIPVRSPSPSPPVTTPPDLPCATQESEHSSKTQGRPAPLNLTSSNEESNPPTATASLDPGKPKRKAPAPLESLEPGSPASEGGPWHSAELPGLVAESGGVAKPEDSVSSVEYSGGHGGASQRISWAPEDSIVPIESQKSTLSGGFSYAARPEPVPQMPRTPTSATRGSVACFGTKKVRASNWKKVQVQRQEPLKDFAVLRGWEELSHKIIGEAEMRQSQAQNFVGRFVGERLAIILVPREDELVHRIAKHRLFQLWSLLVILANTVFLAINIEADVFDAMHTPGSFPEWYDTLATTFNALFLLEVVVRMAGLRMHMFIADDANWHQFDVFIAMAVIFEIILARLTHLRAETGKALMVVRVTRLVRLVRIIRVIRGLQYFSELRLMVSQIACSMRMLLWSMVLVLICTFVVSLIVLDGIAEWARTGTHPEAEVDRLYILIGTLSSVNLNLISCVTGGMDWLDFYWEVSRLNSIVKLAFLSYIACMLFAVMNIVTAIFIEHAVKTGAPDSDHVLKEELANDEKFVEEMRALFEDADEDGSGDITFDELCEFLADMGVRARLKLLGLQVHEAWGLFKLLDVEDRGVLTLEEFCYGCLRLRGSARSLDTATIMSDNKRIFQTLMTHVRELKTGMDRLGYVLLGEASDSEDNNEASPIQSPVTVNTAASTPSNRGSVLT